MKFSIVKNFYGKSEQESESVKKQALAKGWVYDEKNPELVIVIGGDGTFLTAVSKYNKQLDTVKFLPIMSGGIGFYTNRGETEDDFLDLSKTKSVNFDLLEIKVNDINETANDDTFYAVNELKIMNDKLPVHMEVSVNGTMLEHFSGTGLIFSTASGSTGVMKSSGGAVIYPTSELFEMQEIAPVQTIMVQTINSPIVFDKNQTIVVKKAKPVQTGELIIDSKIVIPDFEQITIKLSPVKVNVLGYKTEEDRTQLLKDIFVSSKYEQ